jgi:predicted NAD-dependent protein-ADP-ribosyltransferase YbiA (DUF1768 family)
VRSPAIISDTTYYYMPNDNPYGIFCQWHPGTFTVPAPQFHSLSLHPSPLPPPSDIVLAPKMTFACAEQFYVTRNALYFYDAASLRQILATFSPKEQKKLRRHIAGFDTAEWAKIGTRIARLGNWYRFDGPGNQGMRNVCRI